MQQQKAKSKRVPDAIENIRKCMYNFDLQIAYSKSEMEMRQAIMNCFKNNPLKEQQKRYIIAKAEFDRFEEMHNRLVEGKEQMIDELNLILDKYLPTWKDVFWMFFIEKRSYQYISTKTNYSFDNINRIISILKRDIIQVYQ